MLGLLTVHLAVLNAQRAGQKAFTETEVHRMKIQPQARQIPGVAADQFV